MPPTGLQSFVSTRAQTVFNSQNISQEFEFTLNNPNPLVQERKRNSALSMIKENLDFKEDMEKVLIEQIR